MHVAHRWTCAPGPGSRASRKPPTNCRPSSMRCQRTSPTPPRPKHLKSNRACSSVVICQIAEPGEAVIEEQIDLVGGAMAVLLHQHFGAPMRSLELLHPLAMLRRTRFRLARFQVVFLAINEHHHV